MMRHTKHYFRVGFLVVFGLLFFLLVRAFLLPHSFGQFGFYRADNVAEQMALKPKYGAPDVCATCHGEVWDKKEKGFHKPVPCQDCHGPLARHVDLEKGELVGKMPMQKNVALCLRCHQKLPSRPATFPQIDLENHLSAVGEKNSETVCFNCHNPHDPMGGK